MKKTITFYVFEKGMTHFGNRHGFSYQGLKALFEYLEEYEESTGTEIEFDPIALSCEYTEYDNIGEFWLEYDQEDYPDLDSIYYHTQVIEIDKESFIIQVF